MKKFKMSFNLNHKDVYVEVDPNKRLLDMLRENFGLTGVKEGCGEGECGACTVIMNGDAITSCTVLAPQADGSRIITIEGVSEEGELDEIQEAFIKYGAVQCGFCTPGMVLSIKALLMKNSNPSDEDIKEAIEGNLCRCTGYKKIIDATKEVVANSKR